MKFENGVVVVQVCHDPNDRHDYGIIMSVGGTDVVVKVPRYMKVIEPLDNGSVMIGGMMNDNSYAAIGIVSSSGLEILAHSSHYDTEEGEYIAAGEGLPSWQEAIYNSSEYPYIERE